MEALAITTSEWILLASSYMLTIIDYRITDNQVGGTAKPLWLKKKVD
jgi:hypothetical protein